jgi:hypothetical protein
MQVKLQSPASRQWAPDRVVSSVQPPFQASTVRRFAIPATQAARDGGQARNPQERPSPGKPGINPPGPSW